MIEIVGSIASAVGASVIMLLIGRMRGPVRIKRITHATDPLVSQTLELYQSLFPEDDGTNYSAEELIDCMDARPIASHHVEVSNIILVATFKGTVVGFLFAHFYPARRKAIISYFAVDKNVKEARIDGVAAKRLTIALTQMLRKSGTCDALFYDVERVGPSTPAEERKRKMGRAGLFRAQAKALRLDAREFKFEYLCPKVSMSAFAHEQPFALFCIGLPAPLPRELPKETILEYLRFVYLDCYGDIYPKDDPRFAAHQDHLRKMITHYEETLPSTVADA